MDILSKEWIEVAKKYCERYDVDGKHYGEIKSLKKETPDYAKKIYTKQLKIWKEKGYNLPEDAKEYL